MTHPRHSHIADALNTLVHLAVEKWGIGNVELVAREEAPDTWVYRLRNRNSTLRPPRAKEEQEQSIASVSRQVNELD